MPSMTNGPLPEEAATERTSVTRRLIHVSRPPTNDAELHDYVDAVAAEILVDLKRSGSRRVPPRS
jgi:hypothetical protein